MYKLARHTFTTSILATTLFLGTEVTADAVTDSMKEAMAECVTSNAGRIGSPIDDTTIWAQIVAASTALSYSMVNLFGTDGYANIQEAMVARTRETLISNLEDRGFTGFRSQAIETIEYCMPFALIAASDELARQENAVCPDDTNYVNSVEIITASDSDLRRQYGDRADAIRRNSLLMIQLTTVGAFPEIFRYGQDDYPAFEGSGSIQQLRDALSEIELENMSEARPLVDLAITGIDGIGDRSERLLNLQNELTCIKDWLDIYPADAISRLSSDQ